MRIHTIARTIIGITALTAVAALGATQALADGDHDSTTMPPTGTMPTSHEAPAKMTTAITVTKDAKMGHNLHVKSTRFRWTPANASGKHVQGQGHAHLYIDGKKITRLYGPWFFIGDLTKGKHTIKVTLNGNDHGDYVRGKRVIAAMATVTVA